MKTIQLRGVDMSVKNGKKMVEGSRRISNLSKEFL